MSRVRRVVRRLGGRPLAAVRRRGHKPVLSVVMPVYGVVDYLPAVLDSVLSQDLGDLGTLEILAVDDSSVDGSLEVLRDYARRDHRVRVSVQPNAGQGPARNNAVERVRGEFLTFVDGDDIIPPGSFALMIRTLRASGSDLVVGDVHRFRYDDVSPAPWSRVAHDRDRIGVDVETFPEALLDIIACNRMFTTAFWRAHAVPFRAGIPFQDHVPMLAAYVRARRYDVLATVTYLWRHRENRTSTSQQKARLTTLGHRVDVMAEAHALLLAESPGIALDAWLARTLEIDWPPFVPHGVAGEADYRTLLTHTVGHYLGLCRERPGVLDRVSARQKIRMHLVAGGRWDDVIAADTWFDDAGVLPPAVGRDGAVVADLPDLPVFAGLPDEVLRLSADETAATGGLARVAADESGLRLTGWMVVRGLGVTGTPVLRAWLEGPDGAVIDLPVEPVRLPEANLWGRQRFADYADAGFVARVEHAALPDRAGTWALRVETLYSSVVRGGALLHRLPRSSAAYAVSTGTVTTRWDQALGFCLDVRPGGVVPTPEPGPTVSGARLADGVLTLDLSGGGTHEVPLVGPGGLPEAPGTSRLDLGVAPGFRGDLPQRLTDRRVAAEVGLGAHGSLTVTTSAPLPDEAWGVSGLRRLQDGYAARAAGRTGGVLLHAGSDQVALAAALPEPGVWLVPDHSWPAPAGWRPVLRDSADGFAALAAADLVVSDGPLGPWFERRPGQRHLQTGGPHPWAALGRARWWLEGLTPARVEREVARAARGRDLLLAPSEEVAEWYREQLGAEALVTGSPRDDLLRREREPVRAVTLARHGIDPGRTVVLYAAEHGSAERLAQRLDPSYAVVGWDPRDPDLLLAADAAVLDTGPLRFDWALTRRPMVFVVPDLDRTLEHLAPLVPWAETSPGPTLTTVAGAADALADLDGLATAYADQVAAFDTRFHPLADARCAERVVAHVVGPPSG